MQITVEKLSRSRIRIDSYLSDSMAEISRSTVKKMILAGVVSLNGSVCKGKELVHEGDLIDINPDLLKEFVTITKVSQIVPVKMNLDIVYEDSNTIILNKDEGVVVHPSYNHLDDTLINGLVYYVLNSKDPLVKVRPVNRLDKETSGLIIFSKNLNAHNFYSRQFKRREVTKEYLAVVKGDFLEVMDGKDSIKVETFIGKNPEGYSYRVSLGSLKDEYAETDIYFLEHIEKDDTTYSLLRVLPQTGRTHQIRVHLSHLGFPIVGDTLYGGELYTRVLLHSKKLKIKTLEPENPDIEIVANPKNWF